VFINIHPNTTTMAESCKSEEVAATEAINHIYKAQAQLAESRDSKVLLEQEESAIADMQKELTELRLIDVFMCWNRHWYLFTL
jgi:hypothetical protein